MTSLFRIVSLAATLAGSFPAQALPNPPDAPSDLAAPAAEAAIEDGRARFREVYCAVRQRGGTGSGAGISCDAELHRLADEPAPTGRPVDLSRARLPMRVLVVPGLYGDCLSVSTFSDALPRLTALGHETGVIGVGGFSSVSANAARIRDAVVALDLAPGEPLVLVAYSKGVPDSLEALVAYAEVRLRVTAIVAVAGVVSGSPLADRIGSSRLLAPLAKLTSLSCEERDPEVLAELGRPARGRWLSRYRLPDAVRYYSLAAFDERDRVSRAFRAGHDVLAKLDPRNDGAVIVSDAIVPGSKLLGFVRADHWAVALPFSRDLPRATAFGLDRNEFPRDALLEAVIRTVEEDLLDRR